MTSNLDTSNVCAYKLEAANSEVFGFDISLTAIANAEVYVYTQDRSAKFGLVQALSEVGRSISFNINDLQTSNRLSYVIVIPKTNSASASINTERRTTVFEDSSDNDDEVSVGIIAIIVAASMILVVTLPGLIFFVFLYLRRRIRMRNAATEADIQVATQVKPRQV